LRKGVNAWCFPARYSLEAVLEKASQIGFEGVELNLDEEKLNAFTVTKNVLKGLSEKAASLELELPSLCTGLLWKYSLSSADEKVRAKGVDIVKKGCEAARELGARVLLVVPAVATAEMPYEKTWELAKNGVLQAAKTAQENSVILGVENVWNKFLYSPLEFRAFLREINHSHVKMYIDPGNLLQIAHPTQWIEMLRDYITCVHVKDYDAEEMAFKPLMEGTVPWRQIVEKLREIGYDYYLNVELSPYKGDELKAAEDAKAALDKLLKT